MNLFENYSLWNYFSVFVNYLFYDFMKYFKNHYDENADLSIVRDREYRLHLLKKYDWVLVKNNILNSINGKIRFLIDADEYRKLSAFTGESYLFRFFKTVAARLKNITRVNEMEIISASSFSDPSRLGNTEKYFSVNIRLSLNKNFFFILFIVRDEMLLFPLNRVPTDFLKNLNDRYFKKAYVELDKRIIFDGMKNWGSVLKEKFNRYTEGYLKKHFVIPSDDMNAYRLLLQYLHVLKLYSADIKI